jgi:hypothetical protein
VNAQPEPLQAAFHHCPALVMVESGVARLVETRSGDSPVCVFETIAGDQFSLPKPAMRSEVEQGIIANLREIMNEEGVL